MGNVYSRAFIPAAIIVAISIVCAGLAYWKASLSIGGVMIAYFFGAFSATIVAVLIWIFVRVFQCMLLNAENPIGDCIRRLRNRLPLLLLPALFSPVFLCAYTTAKASISRLTPYNWDSTFATIDRAIFQVDPWIITHSMIDEPGTRVMASIYSFWVLVLPMVQAFVVLYGRGCTISQFYITMLSVWLVGGVWLAFLLASGGPAFVHLFDPSLQERFAPLLAHFTASADPGKTQALLAARFGSAVVERGGGISAMPSMHVAAVTVYVLAARGTRWFWPAVAFALIIWVGSVHLAYHYAVDGIVSAVLAGSLWVCSRKIYDRMFDAGRKARANILAETAQQAPSVAVV